MSKQMFFYHEQNYYNFSQIVSFSIKDHVTQVIILSDGKKLEINTGLLKLEDFISVANPPHNSKYSKP